MKKIFITAGILSAGIFYAQRGNVGINTNSPGATLEVNISTESDIDVTKGQGVAVPRVSKARLAQMTSDIVTSSLVYVDKEKDNDTIFDDTTLVATVGTVNRVAKVDAVGFYYFDGTQWAKVGSKVFTARVQETTGPNYEWTKVGGVDVGLADYYNFETNGGAIMLPKPSIYPNVTIHIKNSTGGIINYTGTNGIDYPWKTSGISASAAQVIWSDGTKWYLIGGRN